MRYVRTVAVVTMLAAGGALPVQAQEQAPTSQPQVLFGDDRTFAATWGLESRTTKIQDSLSATWGIYGGMTINRATEVAVTLAANLTHREVNYGYIGLVTRHTFRPDEVLHGGVGLLLAAANTKDYRRKRSSLFDSFGDTAGTWFHFIEPSAFGEVNLTERTRPRIGLGYRLAWSLDETTEYTARTGVTESDFSGPSVTVGVHW
jgi:hypothetical protein